MQERRRPDHLKLVCVRRMVWQTCAGNRAHMGVGSCMLQFVCSAQSIVACTPITPFTQGAGVPGGWMKMHPAGQDSHCQALTTGAYCPEHRL